MLNQVVSRKTVIGVVLVTIAIMGSVYTAFLLAPDKSRESINKPGNIWEGLVLKQVVVRLQEKQVPPLIPLKKQEYVYLAPPAPRRLGENGPTIEYLKKEIPLPNEKRLPENKDRSEALKTQLVSQIERGGIRVVNDYGSSVAFPGERSPDRIGNGTLEVTVDIAYSREYTDFDIALRLTRELFVSRDASGPVTMTVMARTRSYRVRPKDLEPALQAELEEAVAQDVLAPYVSGPDPLQGTRPVARR